MQFSFFPSLFQRLGRAPERAADLTTEELQRAMVAIREGRAARSQIGAFLMALRLKGVRAEELYGALTGWQDGAKLLDLVAPVLHLSPGFAGQVRTIDLTLPASLVASAAGARVLLMGSVPQPPTYGITPRDILQALGVKTDLMPADWENSLATIGWAYGYFPNFMPRFHRLLGIRKELGVETVLDPTEQLIAPGGLRFVLTSASSYATAKSMAEVLAALHIERGAVLFNDGNTTDLAMDRPNTMFRIGQNQIVERTLTAREFGLSETPLPAPSGLTLNELGQMYVELLTGQPHPYRDAVIFNAAHAIYVAGVTDDFADAMRRADEALLYGTASRKLREFKTNFALK